MSKGRNQKRATKKKPLRTMKQKRKARRDKKNQTDDKIINQ
jgi:hypothetical protein